MDIFLHNKYSRWYFNIISSVQARLENLSKSLKDKPKSEKHKASMRASASKRWTPEAREQWSIKMKERVLLKKQKESQECLV